MEKHFESNIMVSVICLTYNHERYIRQTLEGFVSQITTFDFEVVIHDDASTDNTAAIIREFAEQYPAIFKPVFQTENQYSKRTPIYKLFAEPLVKGKYVALCEGDDYWIDPQKLQKQYDVMEKNPSCSMCTHKIREILEDGTATKVFRPQKKLKEGRISLFEFLKIQRYYPFQTASFFMKTSLWRTLVKDPPAFKRASNVGDEPMLLFMLAEGDLYYLSECMSVYRVFSKGSWSSMNKSDPEKIKVYTEKMYNMMCLFDEYTNHCYDCNINYYQGSLLLLNKEYKSLLTKEHRAFFNELSAKRKLFVLVSAVCPSLGKLSQRIVYGLRKGRRK